MKRKQRGGFFSVFSCSLFLSFRINVLLRIQQHTDDSSWLSYRTFFLSSSTWSGTCNLALELETLSLVCKLQPHPGLSLPENLLQEKHSELSLGDKKGKVNIDMQSSEVQDSRNDILTYYPILRENMTRLWFKITLKLQLYYSLCAYIKYEKHLTYWSKKYLPQSSTYYSYPLCFVPLQI